MRRSSPDSQDRFLYAFQEMADRTKIDWKFLFFSQSWKLQTSQTFFFEMRKMRKLEGRWGNWDEENRNLSSFLHPGNCVPVWLYHLNVRSDRKLDRNSNFIVNSPKLEKQEKKNWCLSEYWVPPPPETPQYDSVVWCIQGGMGRFRSVLN